LDYAPTPAPFPAITDAFDLAQAGWWGQGSTSTPAFIGVLANLVPTTFPPFPIGLAGGVSTSAVQINGFVEGGASAGGDVVNFASAAWGFGGAIFGINVKGLVEGDGHSHISAFFDGNANFGNGPIQGSQFIAGGTTVVEISAIETNAGALAGYLANANIGFAGTGLAAHSAVHMLFAYETLTGVNIADVEFVNLTGAAEHTTNFVNIVAASDLVEITGAHLADLNTHNVHFVGL